MFCLVSFFLLGMATDLYAYDPAVGKPETDMATQRWESGLLPCDPKGANAKIIIAADIHDHPKCLADRKAEEAANDRGENFLVLESSLRGHGNARRYGSEDEASHMVGALVAGLGAYDLVVDPNTSKELGLRVGETS